MCARWWSWPRSSRSPRPRWLVPSDSLLVELAMHRFPGNQFGGWRTKMVAQRHRVSTLLPTIVSETSPSASLHRQPAEFLQAGAAFVPGGGVEDADGRQVIHFETGNHLGSKHDPLRIATHGLWRPTGCMSGRTPLGTRYSLRTGARSTPAAPLLVTVRRAAATTWCWCQVPVQLGRIQA